MADRLDRITPSARLVHVCDQSLAQLARKWAPPRTPIGDNCGLQCFAFLISHARDAASHPLDLLDVSRRGHTVRLDVALANQHSDASFSNCIEVCTRLASPGTPKYVLLWEGFTRTDSNAGPGQVAELLKRVDISKPWESVAEKAPVAMDGLPPSPHRSNFLVTTLQNLLDARNRCAHGAAGTASPQWSVISQFNETLRAIAYGMTAVLENRLAAMPGSH